MTALQQVQKELPSTCRVLAVSKKQSLEKIRALYQQGQRDFAENFVQEALEKKHLLKDLEIRWHLIGQLQSNKAKDVVGEFFCLHSIDSFRLCEKINRIAQDRGLCQSIYLQVNIAREASKSGFAEETLLSELPKILELKNLSVEGLMTMPPLTNSPSQNQPHFLALRQLRDRLQNFSKKICELSMGTSQDFTVAALEGATWVRLGTVLFGERENS